MILFLIFMPRTCNDCQLLQYYISPLHCGWDSLFFSLDDITLLLYVACFVLLDTFINIGRCKFEGIQVLHVYILLDPVYFYICHLVATLCGATINFLANNYLNFYNSRINSIKELTSSLIKYYLINLPGILTSVGAASFAFNVLIRNPVFASLIGVILDTIFKYIISRTWIWRIN